MKTQREWLDEVNKAFPKHWEQACLDNQTLPSFSSLPTVSHVAVDFVGVAPEEITCIRLTVEVDGKRFQMSGRHQDLDEAENMDLRWEFVDAPTPALKVFSSEFADLLCELVDPEGTTLQDWNELPPG